MDRLKYIKLENEDGSYSSSIPLAVDSDYVDVNGNTLTNILANKANIKNVQDNIDNLQAQISSVANGSPAGVYATVAALIAANPDHSKIYLVSADGHWYYYHNNNWTDGGEYQAIRIDRNDPTIVAINKDLSILFNTSEENIDLSYFTGYIANENDTTYSAGAEVATQAFKSSDFVDIKKCKKIKIKVTIYSPGEKVSAITFFNNSKEYIGNYGTFQDGTEKIIEDIDFPIGTAYARFTTNANTLSNSSTIIYNENAISEENAEAINDINNDIDEIDNMLYDEQEQEVNLSYFLGYLANTNDEQFSPGSEVATQTFSSSDFYDIRYTENIDLILTVYSATQKVSTVTFYDEDQHYLGFYGTFQDGTLKTINKSVFPVGAKYARFTTNTNTLSNSSVVIYNTFPIKYLVEKNANDIQTLNDATVNPLNIYWAACGDSITHANHNGIEDVSDKDPYCPFANTSGVPSGQASIYKRKNYAYYIAKQNQLRWANYGWGGSTLINCSVAGVFKNGFSVDRYKELKEDIDFDYISIFFGYNDSALGPIQQREIWLSDTYGGTIYYPQYAGQIGREGYATQEQYDACNSVTGSVGGVYYDNSDDYFRAKFIGTIDDTDNKTWYGAWNTVLPYLMLKYPISKILLIVPYSQGDVAGPTEKQKDAVIDIAKKWGLPYYDFREDCPFMDANSTLIDENTTVYQFRKSYLTSDGLHPSNDGYKYIANSIGAKLMSI